MREKFESVFGDFFQKFLKEPPQNTTKQQEKERKEAEALRQFIDGFNGLKR